VLKLSDRRNFGRTATGLALIAGPLLILIASIVSPDTDHSDKLRELSAIAAHKGPYLLSGVIFLIASMVLMLAAIGLIQMFRGSRGVTLGQVAGVLLLFGSAVSFGWYGLGAIEYEMVNQKGIDRGAMAQLLHKADNASSLLPLIILFLLGIVVGLILLGIAAWRTGVVPRPLAALIILQGPISFFSNGKVGSIVSGVILLVALGSLGRRALSMSDEEWDGPGASHTGAPPRAGAPAPGPAA
jgi:amino acid transporter